MSKLLTAGIGLLSGIIGAAIQISIANKKIYENNVIKERKEWRDKIRSLTAELNGYNPNYKRIKAEFQIRLNPHDKEDENIIESLNDLLIDNEDDLVLDEFNSKVSYLLKHDWDRVKLESNKFLFFPNGAILLILFICSIIIQIIMKPALSKIESMVWIKALIGMDLLYYTITTSITMSIIVLVIKYIIQAFYNNEYKPFLHKFFKIPNRIKYEKLEKQQDNISLFKKNGISKDISYIKDKKVSKNINHKVEQMKEYYNNSNFSKENLLIRLEELERKDSFVELAFGFALGLAINILGFDSDIRNVKEDGIINIVIVLIINLIIVGVFILLVEKIYKIANRKNPYNSYLNNKEIEIIKTIIEND